MVLYEDTRQQAGKHRNIHQYCSRHDIEIIRQALNVGDYQIAGKGDISVDTKYGVPELAMCCFQDHDRFRDERSPIGWDGLPMHKFKPDVLRKVLITMQQEYGVKFRFCDWRSTGKQLIEYLEGKRT